MQKDPDVLTWSGQKWIYPADEAYDNNDNGSEEPAESQPVTEEGKALLILGRVGQVLDKLQSLENPTPEAALAAIQPHIIKERSRFDWLADLQHTRFLTYRHLPRTLDHPTIRCFHAFVRVRYRAHESEETWIKLCSRDGNYLVQTFRPDSS